MRKVSSFVPSIVFGGSTRPKQFRHLWQVAARLRDVRSGAAPLRCRSLIGHALLAGRRLESVFLDCGCGPRRAGT
jgi:hypothetical protein